MTIDEEIDYLLENSADKDKTKSGNEKTKSSFEKTESANEKIRSLKMSKRVGLFTSHPNQCIATCNGKD